MHPEPSPETYNLDDLLALDGPSPLPAVISTSSLPPAGNLLSGSPIPGTMSEGELAAFLSMSSTRVRALCRDGVMIKVDRGVYDVRASIKSYAERMRVAAERAGNPTSTGDPDALKAEKLKLTAAQREAQEMKNSAARADLVSADEVRRGWESILADVRAGMLAVPSRLSDLTPDQRAKLDSEIRLALERLSHG